MTASDFRAARNERSLARLRRALPGIFPGGVLAYALSRPFIPPTPRLAVEGYWRAHPLRADRLARALAALLAASWRARHPAGGPDARPGAAAPGAGRR